MLNKFFQYKNNAELKHSQPLEVRKEESRRIMLKYPDRRPIICQRGYNLETPLLPRNKFLVPHELTIGQFMYVIRKHLKLEPEKGLYLFVSNIIPTNSSLVSNLYDEYKSDDGFLYITYSIENTFG